MDEASLILQTRYWLLIQGLCALSGHDLYVVHHTLYRDRHLRNSTVSKEQICSMGSIDFEPPISRQDQEHIHINDKNALESAQDLASVG